MIKQFTASLLLAIAALAIAPAILPAQEDETAPVTAKIQRPNIIFIFSDDHAYQAVSAYDDTRIKTPNIDRIAAEGALMLNCYVPNSICGPSRAAILTGKYSHKNGFYRNGNLFDGDQWTFPKQLQKAGYETAVIGKWHLGEHMAPKGFNYSSILIGQGPYYNPPFLVDDNGDGNRVKINTTGYTTDIIADQTIEWLELKRDRDKPFMLMTQHKAPHRNWMPALRHLNLFDDVTIPEPPTLFDDYEGRPRAWRMADMRIADTMTDHDLKLTEQAGLNEVQRKKWDAAYGPKNAAFRTKRLSGRDLVRWKYQRYMKDYLRCVTALDENVGRLLDYLDESGLAENTIVVYSSDQGFFLGEHGWFDKRWIYEESLRTPLLVRWPGVIKPGSRIEEIVSVMDFSATFLDVAGVKPPDDIFGRSMVPLLRGEKPDDWREYFYYHYYEYPGWHGVRKHYGVVDGRFKLVHFYETDMDTWHLVDLKADPLEMKNFYGEPGYEKEQRRLHAALQRLREELEVPDEDPLETYNQGNPFISPVMLEWLRNPNMGEGSGKTGKQSEQEKK